MKETVILKLGGSVVTFKNRAILSIREMLLRKVAGDIASVFKKKPFHLVIVHGAGSFGHLHAKKYKLDRIVVKDGKDWRGVLETKHLCQKLNTLVTQILLDEGLLVASFQTFSAIANHDRKLATLDIEKVRECLASGIVPVFYGDMVLDDVTGASICSGDQIVSYLGQKLGAKRILFASDVAGVYTADPHANPNATLVSSLSFDDLRSDHIRLDASHNEDVTGGLRGKMESFSRFENNSLEEVIIFDGLNAKNYTPALLGKDLICTKIKRPTESAS